MNYENKQTWNEIAKNPESGLMLTIFSCATQRSQEKPGNCVGIITVCILRPSLGPNLTVTGLMYN